MTNTKCFILPLIAATAMTACTTTLSVDARHDVAAAIGTGAGMTKQVITAGSFNLTTWQKITKPGAPAHIYIEGDGLAWVSRNMKSLDPTPPDPLALRLAAADPAENVIYLARPCQYSGWTGAGACPDRYWTNARTAPEVIATYQLVFDDLKSSNNITGFDVTGYSGGAAVAMLTAAGRNDVSSIRTVAGNTDYAVFTAVHNISSMDASVDPVSVAAKAAHVPQIHFIGSDDKVVPPAIFAAWQQASGDAHCVKAETVSGASHDKGWVEKWPQLLATVPACTP